MKRREFLAILGGMSALACPYGVLGQPAPNRPHVVGILANEPWLPFDGLRQGLRELGYVEGQNLVVEYRFAEGRTDRYSVLARELVEVPVDLLIAVGTPASLAAKNTTSKTPIIVQSGDPLTVGLVSSLSRPGGNVTGMSAQGGDSEAKRVGLLKELVPSLSRIAVLSNPANPYCAVALANAREAALALSLPPLDLHEAANPTDIDRALGQLAGQRPGAVLVLGDAFLVGQRTRIAEFMIRARLPSMHTFPDHVRAGGLISYGTNFHDLFRRMAAMADKILKGASPGDLPVQQPTVFDMLLNLGTAGKIGLNIAPAFLARADEVIE